MISLSALLAINILASSEFFIHLLILPFSALTAYVISSTSLLHHNLKLILLVQTIIIFMYSLARCIDLPIITIIVPSSSSPDMADYWTGVSVAILRVEIAAISGCMYIGQFLTAERIYATWRVKNYEGIKSPIFNTLWIAILFLISVPDAFGSKLTSNGEFPNFSVLTITLIYLLLFVSLTSYFLLALVNRYNVSKYRWKVFAGGRHNLSERYQLAENIRSSKALSSVLVVHFGSTLAQCGECFLVYYGVIVEDEYKKVMAFVDTFLFTLGNLTIQLLVLTKHPLLRQQTSLLISSFKRRLYSSGRVESSSSDDGVEGKERARAARFQPLTVMGEQLIAPVSTESNVYFQMLKDSWE